MANARSKGRRGEAAAKNLLKDRDWIIIADTSSGISSEDLIAKCPKGTIHSIEVKNRKLIDISTFKTQAVKNAKKTTLPWMLMCKIETTSSWLICRQGEKPTVWHEKKEVKC
jgi:Holliday junction resolvase-like predicted endonuclease